MDNDEVMLYDKTKQDILDKIKEYAGYYTPEWNLNFKNPDAGAAIALLFAEQMTETVKRYNELLNEYHSKFIEMLKISFYPPKPSNATVIVQVMNNVLPGLLLQTGTKFTAQGNNDEEIIFESMVPVYITEAKIDTILMTDKNGRWKMLYGSFKKPAVGSKEYEDIQIEELKEFSLFDIKKSELEEELIIRHSYLLSGEQDECFIKFFEGTKLLDALEEKRLSIFAMEKAGKFPLEQWRREEDRLYFKAVSQDIEGIIIKAEEDFGSEFSVDKITLSAKGSGIRADYIFNDVNEYKTDIFEPFGDTITIYAQCYIGCNRYFLKKNSTITIEFDVEYGEHYLGQQRKREENLKVIKRKRYYNENEYVEESYVDGVVFEYYTGKNWRNLDLFSDASEIFKNGEAGHKVIQFICPEEWKEADLSAYEGRALRIRVLKAENCYIQPCIHHYPIIRNLKIAYSYENRTLPVQKAEKISGFERTDITQQLMNGMSTVVFNNTKSGAENRLYLGFNKKPQGGPVSIWIQMKEQFNSGSQQLLFYYFGSGQWKRLKVVDNTEMLFHSGTILFYPPSDMELLTVYGKPRYYICIEAEQIKEKSIIVTDICLNGVEVQNRETGEEEEYYIQSAEANMEFAVDCEHLLSMDLWVNETNEHTKEQMLKWYEEEPEKIRIEYDYFGEINSFYVKWDETEYFELTENPRVYVLDRGNGKLIFGDGVHTKIPKNTEDAAFKIIPYYCSGGDGNVEAGKINDTKANILYLDSVLNPLPAFGGSMMEGIQAVLERGAGYISSHGRLITESDYIRAVRGFSDLIDKVRCVVQGDNIFLVLLMKDYQKGSGSFYKIKKELKEYLLKRCDMTVLPEHLNIIEPVFVKIHISVWLEMAGAIDIFALSMKMKDRLERYLDPVTGKNGDGWNPGDIPGYSRLVMEINAMKENAIVKNVLVTASYTDEQGTHECNLERLKDKPFVVIKSGTHQIYAE